MSNALFALGTLLKIGDGASASESFTTIAEVFADTRVGDEIARLAREDAPKLYIPKLESFALFHVEGVFLVMFPRDGCALSSVALGMIENPRNRFFRYGAHFSHPSCDGCPEMLAGEELDLWVFGFGIWDANILEIPRIFDEVVTGPCCALRKPSEDFHHCVAQPNAMRSLVFAPFLWDLPYPFFEVNLCNLPVLDFVGSLAGAKDELHNGISNLPKLSDFLIRRSPVIRLRLGKRRESVLNRIAHHVSFDSCPLEDLKQESTNPDWEDFAADAL